ncbi:pantetheine-phosphate adenylyltransferase [Micromonospora soli]|uniref:pantetheine-phosphate adenylyltransferase n=1 Tax=Micromonospora sp. NBRC 110009 TaxID=3061627 RepID=UPI00267330AC|nr:pantetheine-phosphate adenylyltransferase [Micromonospora sp. NBRC 110009]WKT97239.1 pantetheine-phosphate adenylyltransferase [Micromonospora sp. NBRC 110009]
MSHKQRQIRMSAVTTRPKVGRHMYGWDDRRHVVGVAVTATSDRGVVPVHRSLAVYPGTFDPFTPGHRDMVARARVMFDRVIVLLAVNADKRPTAEATTRAVRVRDAMPAAWGNVEVDTWIGLTTAYCLRRGATVIVRGLRTDADLRHEYQLAAMNEQLGIQTVWLPSRPQLAATSSTVARAYRSAQSARSPLNAEE